MSDLWTGEKGILLAFSLILEIFLIQVNLIFAVYEISLRV